MMHAKKGLQFTSHTFHPHVLIIPKTLYNQQHITV